jgi:hypothetical protein
MRGFLIAHGHWDQMAALHHIAQAAARKAGNRTGRPGAHAGQDILRALTDFPATIASLSRAQAPNQADMLNLLVLLQSLAAGHPVTAASYRQVLTLAELGDRLGQAYALHHLGLVLQQAGDYPGAAASLQRALGLFRACSATSATGSARPGP